MKTYLSISSACLLAVAMGNLLLTKPATSQAASAKSAAASYLGDAKVGNPGLKSIGRISFGPEGLLLVADPKAASIVAIDTRDLGPVVKLKKRIDDVDALISGSMGAKPGSVKIVDMAVNPKSGKIYLSVNRSPGNQAAILIVDADGRVSNFDLEKVTYSRIVLPGGEKSKISNITDVKFAGDRVLAAGQCNEEFANKIYSIPVPLVDGSSANIFSAETYHVAHRRWETRAPIRSFVPYEENGKHFVVGAFSCTPIAKFPLDSLESGAKVKGISVVELGSGNKPLDMFTYKKDGKQWLITNTYRFHFKKNLYGPSKWWGVRVDMSYMSAEKINKEAARRDVKSPKGPEGIEIVDALSGAIQVDKLNDNEFVALRDNEGKLSLEVSLLP